MCVYWIGIKLKEREGERKGDILGEMENREREIYWERRKIGRGRHTGRERN